MVQNRDVDHGYPEVGAERRYKMARWVLTLAGSGMILLSILAISLAASSERNQLTQRILDATIPVFATWVGTVLAFYFSSQNLEAASRSVSDLVRQITPIERLRSIVVRSIMIRRGEMVVASAALDPGGDAAVDIKRDVLDKLSDHISRMPVLNTDGSARYMIRGKELYSSLYSSGIKVDALLQDSKSLADLLAADPVFKAEITQAFRVVGADTTLSEAKLVMDAHPRCEDVFVTEGGSASEPIIGWLTDTEIGKHAKV